ncbi:helix-turn-helix domain-containing protein [Terracidiphilus sp.]|uniref:helix-turn-helix domain-containing protein n=1 Tax=Terracidiphilus sp. TaxID=1964191 RepID=UPI003C26EEFA
MNNELKGEPLTTEEQERIKVMAADGVSLKRIGQRLGRSPHTIKRFLAEPEIQRQVQDEKAVMADIYRSKARQIVESISEGDIAKASLQQKSISSGVLLDKALLLTGDMPTIRVEILLGAVAQAKEIQEARAAEAMEAVRRRMAAEALALPAPPKPA